MNDYKLMLDSIMRDARYQRNLDWGKARSGHPEGTVRAHIAELERNLEALCHKLTETDYWRLRVLIHTHDTFKGGAQLGAPITSPNSHASLARAFLADFCDDPDMLAMVQYHDEPFALWRQFAGRGEFGHERLKTLLTNIRDWNLFLAFNIVDGCTEGKLFHARKTPDAGILTHGFSVASTEAAAKATRLRAQTVDLPAENLTPTHARIARYPLSRRKPLTQFYVHPGGDLALRDPVSRDDHFVSLVGKVRSSPRISGTKAREL